MYTQYRKILKYINIINITAARLDVAIFCGLSALFHGHVLSARRARAHRRCRASRRTAAPTNPPTVWRRHGRHRRPLRPPCAPSLPATTTATAAAEVAAAELVAESASDRGEVLLLSPPCRPACPRPFHLHCPRASAALRPAKTTTAM